MKRSITIASLLAATLFCPAFAADPVKAQTDQQMTQLVKEIQAQQAAINENQARIDAKVAAIAEEIRVARIYASRGK